MRRLGKFILQVLREKNRSLRWLGRESGISNSCLSQVTRGLSKTTPEVLLKLAPHLRVEPSKLFEEAGWLKSETANKAKARKK